MSPEIENCRTGNKGGWYRLMKMTQAAKSIRRSTTPYIVAVIFLHFATYTFCSALPPPPQIAVDLIDDIHKEKPIHTDPQQKDDSKTTTSSSYMDHKNLFCGTRMSDLVTLNVTAR